MAKLSTEATIGLFLEVALAILDHLHVREPLIVWGLFAGGLVLVFDSIIRGEWADKIANPSRRRSKRLRLGGVAVVIFALFGWWVFARMYSLETPHQSAGIGLTPPAQSIQPATPETKKEDAIPVPSKPPKGKPTHQTATIKSQGSLPPMTMECGGGNCAQTSGQTGGITAGQITVDTPPLKVDWRATPLTSDLLPSGKSYGQRVIVTPNIAFQPVSLAIFCDQEIKAVTAYGAMFHPRFSVAAESDKVGLVYYDAPPLGPGVDLTIDAFSDKPFNVIDVKPVRIRLKAQ